MDSVKTTAIPAGVMLLGSLCTILYPYPPSKNLAHAIQHLAAGILLSAIALELIPTIASSKQTMSIVGMVVGFSLGNCLISRASFPHWTNYVWVVLRHACYGIFTASS